MKAVVEIKGVCIGRVSKIEDSANDFKYYVDLIYMGGKMNLRTKLEKFPPPDKFLLVAVEVEAADVVVFKRQQQAFIPQVLLAFELMK